MPLVTLGRADFMGSCPCVFCKLYYTINIPCHTINLQTGKSYISLKVYTNFGILPKNTVIFILTNCYINEYSVHIMQLFRTFSAGHPEIRCSDSGCQCSPL